MCVRIEDGGVCFFPVWRYFLFLVQQPGNKRSRCYNIAHIQFFSQCFFIVYVTICVCLQTWMSMTLYVNVMHAQLVFATFYYKLQNSICTPLNSSFFFFFFCCLTEEEAKVRLMEAVSQISLTVPQRRESFGGIASPRAPLLPVAPTTTISTTSTATTYEAPNAQEPPAHVRPSKSTPLSRSFTASSVHASSSDYASSSNDSAKPSSDVPSSSYSSSPSPSASSSVAISRSATSTVSYSSANPPPVPPKPVVSQWEKTGPPPRGSTGPKIPRPEGTQFP